MNLIAPPELHIQPEYMAAYVRKETGLDIPDEAYDFYVGEVRHRPVGDKVKTLVPDERYSVGLLIHRNPTYTEIERQQYVTEKLLTWKVGDQIYAAWIQVND